MPKPLVSAGFEYPQLRIQPEEIPEPALRDMARGWFNLTREYQSQPGAKERHEKWLEQYRARKEARGHAEGHDGAGT